MRQAVKLYKFNIDSYGELDKSDANSKVIKLTQINMTGLVSGTDYQHAFEGSATFRGKTAKVCAFDMYNTDAVRAAVTGFDVTGKYDILPKYTVKYQNGVYNFLDAVDGYEAIPIGEKPADWEWRFRDKYYVQSTESMTYNGNKTIRTVRGVIASNTTTNGAGWDTSSAWSATAQYYVAKPGYEGNVLYITERLLSFGASNLCRTNNYTQRYENFGTALMIRNGARYMLDGSSPTQYAIWGVNYGWSILTPSTKTFTTPYAGISTSTSDAMYNCWGTTMSGGWGSINIPKWTLTTGADTIVNGITTMAAVTYNGTNYVGMCYIKLNNSNQVTHVLFRGVEDFEDDTESLWGVEPELPPEGGGYPGPTSTPGGGNGTYTDTDDGVTINGVNGGFAFGADPFGFKTYDTTGSTYSEVIRSIFSGTYNEKMVAQLSTGIVDCYGLAIPATSGSPMDITILGDTMRDSSDQPFNTNVIVANQEYLDCGTIPIARYYDTFMDFDPYTKISISIPFIGKYEIPVNEVMYGSIGLKYRQDNQTGDLVAFVEGTNQFGDHHIIAMFSGNGKYTLPVTGAAKNNAVLSASLSAGGKVLGGAYVGASAAGKVGALVGTSFGPGGTVAGAVLGAGIGVLASLPDIQAGNSAPETGQNMVSLSGNQGYLGYLTPYIEITRTMYLPPETQGRDKGYPSNTTQILKDLTGFVKVKNLEMENIAGATEEEKAEILLLLSKGVYVYFPDEG